MDKKFEVMVNKNTHQGKDLNLSLISKIFFFSFLFFSLTFPHPMHEEELIIKRGEIGDVCRKEISNASQFMKPHIVQLCQDCGKRELQV